MHRQRTAVSVSVLVLVAALLGAGAAPPGPAYASPSHVARACAVPTKAHTMNCLALRRTDIAQSRAVGAAVSPAGFLPADLINAYKLPASSTTATVAIVDAFDDPNAESDLAAYRSQFGLPACTTANGCFSKVNQNGATSPLPASDTGWAGEISLDLDMVSAICPTCHILLVEANSAFFTDLYAAEDYAVAHAKFVSNSWGNSEYSGQTTDDAHFNHPGVAITFSSGDDGNGAEYPAASKYVTAVGGTSLSTASNARGWTESTWNGAGSGCSALDAKPTWQTVTTNCSRRAEADVSAVADPDTGVAVYQTFGADPAPGWQIYGGTSAGAPIIAAVYALAGTPSPSGYAASYPYSHTGNLFDVTSGNNGTCGSPQCTAGTGWDGPTGLGTPNGTAAFTAPATAGVTVNNPGDQTGTVGTAVNLTMTASGGTGSFSWSASGLPAGLSINASNGVISGTPTTAGTSSVTVTATSGTQSGSATFSWTVGSAATSDIGTYYPLSPYRILDTRSGLGGPHGAVGDGGVVSLQVTGSGGVPADASTVVLNVTVTEPTGSGFVTVYPDGVARPNSSSLNFTPGWTGANSVTVKIGDNGKVDLFNAGGSVQLVADVFGYYTKGHTSPGFMGGQYHPVVPVRLVDTRTWPNNPVPGGFFINAIGSAGAAVDPHIRAFAVNITATGAAGSGFLTAWNGDPNNLPGTSTVNYTAGATVPNFAVVPTMPCVDCGGAPPAGDDGLPSIGVFTTTTTQIIVDVVGYYDDGTLPTGVRFSPIVPTRITDTRIGQGWPARLGSGETASILTPSSIANADTRGLALNVTGVLPTAPTFLTVWPSGANRPDTSNLNPSVGSVVPNAVQTGVGVDDRFNVFNAGGFCDVVVDVVGTFYQYPPTTPADAANSQVAPALMKVGQSSTQFKRP